MKKAVTVFLACVILAGVIAGCSGVTDSAGDRYRRYQQITDVNTRQFVDDWDYLWLMEKNSRLTPWHTRVGG